MNPGQTTRLVTWLCKYGSSLALRPAEHLPDVSGFKGQEGAPRGLAWMGREREREIKNESFVRGLRE